MKVADERGAALIMVLIMTGVLSVIAASLVFVAQTETWSSQNYRLMTEARYAAESGVHKAANFILNSYAAPTSTGTDLIGNYDISTSPVRSGGYAVELRSSDTSSNYPVAAVKTAFVSSVHGTLTGGTDTVTYDAIATLVSMRQISVYGSTTLATVQTWRIVGRGTLAGAKPARVDVEAILERQVNPVFSYAAFATCPDPDPTRNNSMCIANPCQSLYWQGAAKTYSYNANPPTNDTFNGNVGTNSNLTLVGSAEINGTLSTPRTGTGTCSAGSVTALTGSITKVDGLVELPQPVRYAPPDPYPLSRVSPLTAYPVTTSNGSTGSLDPTKNYGDVVVGNGKLYLPCATLGTTCDFYVNSMKMNGNGDLIVSGAGRARLIVAGFTTAGTYQAEPGMTDPVLLMGNAALNVSDYDSTRFQVIYGGKQTITMGGTSGIVGLIYAPMATVTNTGTPDWYGAIIANRVTEIGNAAIHYDRRLASEELAVGAWMMNSFTWRRF